MLKKPKLFQNGCAGNKKKKSSFQSWCTRQKHSEDPAHPLCVSVTSFNSTKNLVHMNALGKLSEATVPGLERCSKHSWPIWCPSPAGWFPRLLDLLDGLPSVLEHQIDRADRSDSVTLLTFYWHHQVMECPHILGHGHFLHPAPSHLPPPTTTYHFLPPPTTT